ncbi:MAG TPA: putative DNA binding domain-containing protein [Candidatus Anaerostipes avistercoris]|uniref:DNA binding domain-containing protein n=1 Tax=Candidatus Anaerostipes avistercoris TaxID=2838462 RepID=A0A9D2PIS6_9FIRM|nr:RNA-binding domain-containing protein [uncultured Anaerostipes sp.]HJC50225.1 putative DNA binding domain-containing protein [Candidatus Anaerostipes avistercoris]
MRTIPKKETLTVEFKSDLKKLRDNDLIEAIIGMTNTDGGVLYLGVEDNGEITGVHKQHADEIGVVALIANKTVPSVAARAEIITEEGLDVLKIEIPMSKTIVASADGKILRRRLKLDGTPENVPMYPFEINTRLSELSLLDFSAQVVTEAQISDLDSNERERLRRIIKMRKGEESLLKLSDEELDKALRLVKEENGILYPTVTGMLLIGKEERLQEIMPTAKASFQVLEGTKVRVNEQFAKPILATFEIFENYMKAWNPEREMEYGLFRIPIPEFSEAAFREGLVNAFCHRDYSILQMVRLAIEDEGMTISSPGGFIEGVNLNNLLTVEPHGRNQALADALKRIGLAERTGRGIDRIFEGSIIYGRPVPDYSESTERYVKLFIQRAKPDLAFARMIANEENRMGRMLPIHSLLILSTLQTQRRATIRELAEAIHISEARTKANVERLRESGLVEASGSGKGRAYILSAKVYKAQNNAVGYVRQTGIDQLRFEELICKLAGQQGYVTRDNVSELLNISTSQAYRLLKKLTGEKKLVLVGRGRAARYELP